MRGICILEITVSAILLSTAALAQAPPTTKPPVAPKAEQLDRNACAQTDTPSTMGKGAEIDRQTQDAQGNLSGPSRFACLTVFAAPPYIALVPARYFGMAG
jgi:hypothetical protein